MVCRRIKPLSNAAIRALWLDPSERMDSIEAKAGCSYDTVRKRAYSMGLPPRTALRATYKFPRDALFRAMWRAGVSAYEMGRYYRVDQSAISRAAADCPDLAPRSAGQQPRMRLSTFLETLLAARMAAGRAAELARTGDTAATVVPVDLDQLFPVSAEAHVVIGQQWRALMGAGLTAAEAAAQRGVTENAAHKWAAAHGLQWSGKRRAPNDQIHAEWAALHVRGLTSRQAADARGCTPDAARRWARKAGVRWAEGAVGVAA